MNTFARIGITAGTLLIAIFLAGLLSMAYGDGPRGGPYGLMMAGIAAIPFVAWWLTGRTKRRS